MIFGYGENHEGKNIETPTTIKKMIENFKINYNNELILPRKNIIENKFLIKFYFVDENEQTITKEIICNIY